jgi:hypothetical protein
MAVMRPEPPSPEAQKHSLLRAIIIVECALISSVKTPAVYFGTQFLIHATR